MRTGTQDDITVKYSNRSSAGNVKGSGSAFSSSSTPSKVGSELPSAKDTHSSAQTQIFSSNANGDYILWRLGYGHPQLRIEFALLLLP